MSVLLSVSVIANAMVPTLHAVAVRVPKGAAFLRRMLPCVATGAAEAQQTCHLRWSFLRQEANPVSSPD